VPTAQALVQTPSLQMSPTVHASPSSHTVPAAVGLWVGRPLSHPSTVHGLLSSTGTHSAPPEPSLPLPLEADVDAEELLEDEEAVDPGAPPIPPVAPVPPQPSAWAKSPRNNTARVEALLMGDPWRK
jgi:hypothetical protein